jgi:hypothetical protein
MILGDIRETLPAALSRIGAPAALAHADIGTGDPAVNAEIAVFLGRTLPGLMAPDAVVLADRPLAMKGWKKLGLPSGVRQDRYFVYRQT